MCNDCAFTCEPPPQTKTKTEQQLLANIKELKDAVKQMLGTFDTPIARRKQGQWDRESCEFAREILTRICKEDGEEIGYPL